MGGGGRRKILCYVPKLLKIDYFGDIFSRSVPTVLSILGEEEFFLLCHQDLSMFQARSCSPLTPRLGNAVRQ
jgi:hypothetical protein